MKESSIIKDVEWASERLIVTLKNNKVYEYENIPKKIFEDFISAESLGNFYATKIAHVYDPVVQPLPVITPEQSTDILEWSEDEGKEFYDIVTDNTDADESEK